MQFNIDEKEIKKIIEKQLKKEIDELTREFFRAESEFIEIVTEVIDDNVNGKIDKYFENSKNIQTEVYKAMQDPIKSYINYNVTSREMTDCIKEVMLDRLKTLSNDELVEIFTLLNF
jgi:DNA-binding transcriptional regulator GbsR (MarR family)